LRKQLQLLNRNFNCEGQEVKGQRSRSSVVSELEYDHLLRVFLKSQGGLEIMSAIGSSVSSIRYIYGKMIYDRKRLVCADL